MSAPVVTVSAQYRRDYQRGWKASERNAPGALERADMKGTTPDAWYDGWSDYSIGADYLHLATCDGACGLCSPVAPRMD